MGLCIIKVNPTQPWSFTHSQGYCTIVTPSFSCWTRGSGDVFLFKSGLDPNRSFVIDGEFKARSSFLRMPEVKSDNLSGFFSDSNETGSFSNFFFFFFFLLESVVEIIEVSVAEVMVTTGRALGIFFFCKKCGTTITIWLQDARFTGQISFCY